MPLAFEENFTGDVSGDFGGATPFGGTDEEGRTINLVLHGHAIEVEVAGRAISEVSGLEVKRCEVVVGLGAIEKGDISQVNPDRIEGVGFVCQAYLKGNGSKPD